MTRSKIYIMNAKSVRSLKNFTIISAMDFAASTSFYKMYSDAMWPAGTTNGKACQMFAEYVLHNLETHISHNCVGGQFKVGLPFDLYIPHSVWKEIM